MNPACGVTAFLCVLDELFGTASSVLGAAADSALADLANAVGGALAWLVARIAESVAGENPHLTSSAFLVAYTSGPELLSFGLSALFVVVGITHAMATNRHERMGSTVARYIVALSVVTSLPFMGMLALDVGDALTYELTKGIESDLAHTFASMSQAALDFNTIPIFLAIVLSLVGIVAALFLALIFMLRDGAIYLLMFFAPIAMAAWVWNYTARWIRKMGELLLALVLIKPVIGGTLALGVALFGANDGWRALLIGIALLLLAMVAPFAVVGLISLGDAATVGQISSTGSRAATSAMTAGRVTRDVATRATRSSSSAASAGAASSSGTGGAASGAAASGVPIAGAAIATARTATRGMTGAVGNIQTLAPPSSTSTATPAPPATRQRPGAPS